MKKEKKEVSKKIVKKPTLSIKTDEEVLTNQSQSTKLKKNSPFVSKIKPIYSPKAQNSVNNKLKKKETEFEQKIIKVKSILVKKLLDISFKKLQIYNSDFFIQLHKFKQNYNEFIQDNKSSKFLPEIKKFLNQSLLSLQLFIDNQQEEIDPIDKEKNEEESFDNNDCEEEKEANISNAVIDMINNIIDESPEKTDNLKFEMVKEKDVINNSGEKLEKVKDFKSSFRSNISNKSDNKVKFNKNYRLFGKDHQESDQDNKLNLTNLSDDSLESKKDINSSEPDENSLSLTFNNTFINESLKEKLEKKALNIMENKEKQKNAGKEQMDKIRSKIRDIKQKKKQEQLERRERMQEKLEKFQQRHNNYLEERVSRAKNQQVKLDEINFIKRIQQNRKTKSINNKLIKTNDRRELYLKEKIDKSSKDIEKVNEKKALKKLSVDKLNELRSVFKEDFIWKLMEADFFDVEELLELNNMNRFELMKRKLNSEYKFICELLKKDNKEKGQLLTSRSNFSSSSVITNKSIGGDSIAEKICFRKSKSFSIVSETEASDLNFIFSVNKKETKKKKKEKEPVKIKHRLLKTINSMSASELVSFFSDIKQERKTRKYLIKSKKNYLKAQATVSCCEESEGDLEPNQENSKEILIKEDDEKKDESNKKLTNKIIQDFLEKNKHLLDEKEYEINISENTLFIENENLINLLENKVLNVKFCKLCNCIIEDVNLHISSKDHKSNKQSLKGTMSDDNNVILAFNFQPGDQAEEIKTERNNSIKLKFKKIKQQIALKALKHENWSSKVDFSSTNKQRIQKICFDVDKMISLNQRDFEAMEALLKELFKIVDQRKTADLHLLRSSKIIHYIFELMKKPPACHKSEIKALGKVLEIGIKVVSVFSTIRENKNYLIVTNKITVCVDLLLWLLNKPSKLPLALSFLPELVNLITITLKHRLPFEYSVMKDDLIEYIVYSTLLNKLKSKYSSLQGPLDLTSNALGSFPLFLIKTLQMIDSLFFQMYCDFITKPVFIKLKINENILYIIENTELLGQIQLLYSLLLSEGSYKKEKGLLPISVASGVVLSAKIFNSFCRINLTLIQSILLNNVLLQESLFCVFNYIINYSLDYLDNDETKEILHESLLMIGYISLLEPKLQLQLLKGSESTLIQKIFSLPFNYFFDKKLKEILMPSIISMTYENKVAMEIINKEVNLSIFTIYLKEKISLEPIVEEDYDVFEESEEKSLTTNCSSLKKGDLISNASSTKSCHDMVKGVSDFVGLALRFPRKFWEKALDFYSKF